ncbi:MAG: hypothetical protein QM756_04195 [Polyangiaceae bacterium]
MLSMRALLSVSPFLPIETQQAVRVRSGEARRALVYLGVNECEARELLDEKVDCSGKRGFVTTNA